MAAKKKSVPDKPIISRVPLPISDSALVIDLPDGQKLVIGKWVKELSLRLRPGVELAAQILVLVA